MLGYVQRNEVDTFAAAFASTLRRLENFAFTPPFAVDKETIVVSSLA